jgi:hypothetical protein
MADAVDGLKAAGETPDKKARNRSPAYPSFGLKEAVEKAKIFNAVEGFVDVPADVAIKTLGFTPTGSTGLRALAALIHFGLLIQSGSGSGRRVKLSEAGKTIALAPDERAEERNAALRAAAIRPKLYAALWTKYGGKLPSDNTLEYDLLREHEFNPDSVKGFIKDFRATMEFAKPGLSAILVAESGEFTASTQPEGNAGEGHRTPPPIKEKPMAAVGQPDAQPFDLPVPLIGGGTATLRMPRPISGEDYDHMVAFLDANLKALRKALVRDPIVPKVEPEP